ncbi:polyadenylate-binding protein 2-like [Saccostrea cucullata]|uniref:polyadenylate-binding protein 2-like n=1 Tax=Saccostrea cuccullata TaxID=36930 RepID=UPI002ED08BA6
MSEIDNETEQFHEDHENDNEFDTEAQLLESGEIEGETNAADDSTADDPELEAIKARVREMEEEAEKLKEMQKEVDTQMNMTSPTTASPFPTPEEKMDADNRSVYVGNVDYGATAEELEQHFHGCGSVNRVTILCDKYTGHPKGFAYVEFADKDSVTTAQALDESLFGGRQIKVSAKRTNRPGISTTNRKPRGFRPRGRFRSPYGGGGYTPRRPSRFRRAAFYSPY